MKPKELSLGIPLKSDTCKSISSLFTSHYGSDCNKEVSLSYITTLLERQISLYDTVEVPKENENQKYAVE